MSNQVGLYLGTTKDISAMIKAVEISGDETLYNIFTNWDSDRYLQELAEMYESANLSGISHTFFRIILSSWIDDGIEILDIDEAFADENAIELAISPESCEKYLDLTDITALELAGTIFTSNEIWQSKPDLADYINKWLLGLQGTIVRRTPLIYKIWI